MVQREKLIMVMLRLRDLAAKINKPAKSGLQFVNHDTVYVFMGSWGYPTFTNARLRAPQRSLKHVI